VKQVLRSIWHQPDETGGDDLSDDHFELVGGYVYARLGEQVGDEADHEYGDCFGITGDFGTSYEGRLDCLPSMTRCQPAARAMAREA
jgi:hypothetical protein